MPSIRTVGVFALIVAVLMALWGWSEVGRYSDLYKTEKTSRIAAQAALKRVQIITAKVDKKNDQLRFSLDESLRLNREWADRPVPPAVYGSLCARANCAGVQPVSAPSD